MNSKEIDALYEMVRYARNHNDHEHVDDRAYHEAKCRELMKLLEKENKIIHVLEELKPEAKIIIL